MLTFDQIEGCFPEGAVVPETTGLFSVPAQWLHDFARAIEAEVLGKREPMYAFRRKGQPYFCTCNEERHNELAQKPTLFEVKMLYTSPQPCPKCVDLACDKGLLRIKVAELQAKCVELEAELEACTASNKAVEAALSSVPYKGPYAAGVEYLKASLMQAESQHRTDTRTIRELRFALSEACNSIAHLVEKRILLQDVVTELTWKHKRLLERLDESTRTIEILRKNALPQANYIPRGTL